MAADLRIPRNATLGLSFRAEALPADAAVSIGPLTNAEGVTLPAEGFTALPDRRGRGGPAPRRVRPPHRPEPRRRPRQPCRGRCSIGRTWALTGTAAAGTLDNPAGAAVRLARRRGRAAAGRRDLRRAADGRRGHAPDRADRARPEPARRPDAHDGRVGPTGATCKRLFPAAFESVEPRLIDRGDRSYDAAVGVLDRLVTLEAHAHRLALLRPGAAADREVAVGGTAAARLAGVRFCWPGRGSTGRRSPTGYQRRYWPLPDVEYLDRYPAEDQYDYWRQAADHFDQNRWLGQAPLVVGEDGPVGLDLPRRQRLVYNAQAARLLANHPGVRVQVPLELDQLEVGAGEVSADTPRIPEYEVNRLIPASAGLVSDVPINSWPAGLDEPRTWLPTRGNSLIPYVGGGERRPGGRAELGVAGVHPGRRRWSIGGRRCRTPTRPDVAGDPGRTIWFYPGDVVRPAGGGRARRAGLKWLRQAQQDYELLDLARQRGETASARILAKLLAKPVQIRPLQEPDPAYLLMAGTAEASAWEEARRLVTDAILLKRAGRDGRPGRAGGAGAGATAVDGAAGAAGADGADGDTGCRRRRVRWVRWVRWTGRSRSIWRSTTRPTRRRPSNSALLDGGPGRLAGPAAGPAGAGAGDVPGPRDPDDRRDRPRRGVRTRSPS